HALADLRLGWILQPSRGVSRRTVRLHAAVVTVARGVLFARIPCHHRTGTTARAVHDLDSSDWRADLLAAAQRDDALFAAALSVPGGADRHCRPALRRGGAGLGAEYPLAMVLEDVCRADGGCRLGSCRGEALSPRSHSGRLDGATAGCRRFLRRLFSARS